eukprot:TRINITY_DN4616_c0_g1_i1.p1 TRINITY_DN4616_c0_g1~~TRINITY_DN4616_c0_g1_i1.p1  ORF type:complete len:613 (-),score=155.28 TRINITY_DN4616_c0_g1_i1:33-1871(-)
MSSFFQLKPEHCGIEKKQNTDYLALKKRKRKEKKENIYELPERRPKVQQEEEPTPVHNFNVTLRRFALRDLSSKKVTAFLEGNFDNFKLFRTPIVSNEVYGAWWGCQFSFTYYTRYLDKLHNKFLEIDIFEKRLLQHVKIGTVKVELDSLALGPVFHDLMVINDKNVDVGRLEFECVMEQESDVKISLEDVWCHLGKNSIDRWDQSRTTKNYGHQSIGGLLELSAPKKQVHSEMYLNVSFSPPNYELESFQSDVIEDMNTQGWTQIKMFRKTTLKKLKATKLLVELKEKRAMGTDKVIGVCWIPFKKYLLLRAKPTRIPFTVNLESVCDENLVLHPQNFHLLDGKKAGRSQVGSSSAKGILRGFVLFDVLPIKAQLIGGRHTENGVFGGELLLEGLSFPRIYRGDKNFNGDSEEEADEVRNADQNCANEELYENEGDCEYYDNEGENYVNEDEVDVSFEEESKPKGSSNEKLGITITPPFETIQPPPYSSHTRTGNRMYTSINTITHSNSKIEKAYNSSSNSTLNKTQDIAISTTQPTLPREKTHTRTQSYSQFFNPFSDTTPPSSSISNSLTYRTPHFVSSQHPHPHHSHPPPQNTERKPFLKKEVSYNVN